MARTKIDATSIDYCEELLRNSKKRSCKVGMINSLSLPILRKMWRDQNGRCALTGIKFDNRFKTKKNERRPFIPSLDRINSRLGYKKMNCRIVCFAVNAALHTWGDSVFDVIVQARMFKVDVLPQTVNRRFKKVKLIEFLTRGEAEIKFGLFTGWFNEMERFGIAHPAPRRVNRGVSGKVLRYFYRSDDLEYFFDKRPFTRHSNRNEFKAFFDTGDFK